MKPENRHQHCCSDGHNAPGQKEHVHEDDGHSHVAAGPQNWLGHWPLLTALVIIMVMMLLEYAFHFCFSTLLQLGIYIPAYLLSGYNVLGLAFRKALRLDFFNEFFLMSVATLGAFAIGAYSEAVAVMVFYSIGEWFQDAAVSNAKRSIKALLDIRPDSVNVLRGGQITNVNPSQVQIGDVIQVKPGEKVGLDGELISDKAMFNTAALTGESRPDNKTKGETVLAGMINLNQLAEIRVKALFKDSKLSRILEMVQDATTRKSRTQLFISRFAKVYTPIVFLLAVLVVGLPYLLVTDYVFSDWLYRGLVFLVISCPCALVVSIPLGYFGGIGLASKNGILFKGANFLDVMTKVDMVVMDKTGTLTKGVFNVQKVVGYNFDERELLTLAATLESKSTHPVALAIVRYAADLKLMNAADVEEIAGHGLKGMVDDRMVLAGNTRLLKKFNIGYDPDLDSDAGTIVALVVDNRYAGYISIADELKADAKQAITDLHALNIQTVMLSGDKQSVVDNIAGLLGMDKAFGDLLPEDKVAKVEALKQEGRRLAFVGDGVNDAPVVALADAGIAMGGLGSDATIETADIVIQNDQPSKIVTAIRIGKITRNVVWQNIILAMTIKVIVLVLGAGGVATLWEAVIADVGVALLAILNAVRIQRIRL
ncbi:heavy metal translocating P-type ATPase [Pedobacter ginsengisoli]|uniref:heavy metal translocating P-type ATPase n=1 Tax=Pedobacter ginsengisoli TaxID=363852 RepID=UPI00254B8365|nr:heavy metal translocating P-type ATPase [Pedobacter ginsengisoli]